PTFYNYIIDVFEFSLFDGGIIATGKNNSKNWGGGIGIVILDHFNKARCWKRYTNSYSTERAPHAIDNNEKVWLAGEANNNGLVMRLGDDYFPDWARTYNNP